MFFQFSPPVRQIQRSLKKEPTDEETVLTLAPFTPNPKISFENVKVGQRAVEKLTIKNPGQHKVEVQIHIASSEDTQIELNWAQSLIRNNEEETLELSWTPTTVGSWRVMLHVSAGKIMKDIPIVLKSTSVKGKKPPRYVVKKKSPVANRIKSPMKRAPLPNITNVPEIRVFSPKKPSTGKENFEFHPNLVTSGANRRDTYVVSPPEVFDDSLESPKNFSFENKLCSDSFVLTPRTDFYPEHCSTDEKSLTFTNLITKKTCLFPGTANISGETYTKNVSSQNLSDIFNDSQNATPPSVSKKARLDSLSGVNVKDTIQAGLWSNSKRQLLTIQEELKTPIKRKSDIDTTYTISPKRQNLGNCLTDWTKDKTALFIDPEMAAFLEKQETNFKKWLNAILAPPSDLHSNEQAPVDVAKLWKECQRKNVELPEIQVTSSRLNFLRKNFQILYKSKSVQDVLNKVNASIDINRLSIRTDRDVHLDLALQSDIMSVVLSYNPLWLRLGLETIYNRNITLRSNSDVFGLTSFLSDRFIRDPLLLKKYKSVHSPQYSEAIKKFILKKFLALVYFLDSAKTQKLIPHDPCLFCKNAPIKESREALLKFSRETLSSMGDVTKYLKHFKYVVDHKQTYLNEFDYTVHSLGVDLRDGVRLTRVMEVILLKKDLSKNLRVPAISRLQKIHNMKLVFDVLKKSNFDILYDINPKDIVDGHKEKTLSFLWQLIYKFQTPLMKQSVNVIVKWWRSDAILSKRQQLREVREKRENAAVKIQNWYRRKLFEKKQMKFASFVKIMTKLQSHVRCFLARRRYLKLKYCVKFVEETYSAKKLMRIERQKYEVVKSSVLLIQRKFRAKRVSNIARLHFLVLKHSAIVIQQRWRAELAMRVDRLRFETLKATTIMIQRRFRAKLEMRKCYFYYQKLKVATEFVQARFRATLKMKQDLTRFQVYKNSAITIQRKFRATVLMKREVENYESLKWAALIIQRRFRANRVARLQFEYYQNLKKSTILAQSLYRRKIQFLRYQKFKNTVIFIQRHFKAKIEARKQLQIYQNLKSSTILMQRRFRATQMMKKERQSFKVFKIATICIQQKFRANKLRQIELQNFKKLKNAALFIQKKWRAKRDMKFARRRFESLKKAAISIQKTFKAKQQFVYYQKLKAATILIQIRYRAKILMMQQLKDYQNLKNATLLIQRRYRAKMLCRKQYQEYQKLMKATLIIQRRFRAKQKMMVEVRNYQNLRSAVIKIQRRFRVNKEVDCYQKLKQTTIMIQRRFRDKLITRNQYRYYQKLKLATIMVQRRFRANIMMKIEMKNYQKLKSATLVIQTRFRAKILSRNQYQSYQLLRKSVIIIQKRWVAKIKMIEERRNYQNLKKATLIIQRRFKAMIKMRREIKDYQNLKRATLAIQRRFRAKILSKIQYQRYQLLKKSIIIIQRRWVAKKKMIEERRNFQNLKKATLIIQRRFRAMTEMKQEMKNYQILKSATLVIQRRFRAKILSKLQYQRYQLLKKSVIIIQRRWIAKMKMIKEMKNYQTLIKATLIIQRRFRAKQLAQMQRQEYIKLVSTAIFVQTKFRAKLEMCKARRNYQILKKTVILVQRRFRANKLCKYHFEDYQKLKNATIFIQQRLRAQLLMKKEKKYFEDKKQAVILVQRRFREFQLTKSLSLEYQKVRKAVIFVQQKFRANRAMKTQIDSYQKLKEATILIQRRFRANSIAKKEFSYYQKLKHSTIFIQRLWRGKILMRQTLENYQELRATVIFVQNAFRRKREVRKAVQLKRNMNIAIVLQKYARGFLVRKKFEGFLAPEAVEARKVLRLQNKAAIKIQNVWRGYKVRQKQTPRLMKIYEKLKIANQNAKPENTLSSRCKKALLKFSDDNISTMEILRILKDLSYITRRCKQSLQKLAPNLSKHLYETIIAINRCPHEMELCTEATSILINFYRFEPTRIHVWQPEYMETLINVLLHFCDKDTSLFPTVSTLFWFFLQNKEYRQFILQTPKCKDKMRLLKEKCERKARMMTKIKQKHTFFTGETNLPLPSIVPDWGLDYKHKPNIFVDSVQAVSCIWKSLGF